MAVPLLLWGFTGLLFQIKPGWTGAYETLEVAHPEAALPGNVIDPGELLTDSTSRLELLDTALGPVYVLREADGTSRIVDALGGETLSPLSEAQARAVVLDAVSQSSVPQRYGEIAESKLEEKTATLTFNGKARVTIDRYTLELSQSGPDTHRIDTLYRIHYLQWTGRKGLDRFLGLAGILLLWGLAFAGLWLFFLRR